jgi:hypothetical protein
MDIFNYTESIQPLLGWLAGISLCTFILSLLLIPWLVGRLSQDCFLKLSNRTTFTSLTSTASILLIIVRNLFGLLLLLAGIAMLFLPGQGLLTILLGILLISFPGKQKLIANLAGRPGIQRSMDWIRRKRGKAHFNWPKPKRNGDIQ